MRPEEIEVRSFRIIDSEAGPHDFSEAEWSVVRRMIHTSADFDYMKTTRFHPDAVAAGLQAIRQGRVVVTDTRMAEAGIRRNDLARFGGSVRCFITDPAVAQAAKRFGTTRARAAVDAAAQIMEGGIYVVGNAPTALLRLLELLEENRVRPALVVGLPVGFVNAAESKAALMQRQVPFITNVGRKGGSNVAASVVNALAIMAAETHGKTGAERIS